jgi:hypothetical protein
MPLDQITEDKILKWIAQGNTAGILTMISVLKEQRDRAELQRDAYLHQIHELSKRTKAILGPLLSKPTRTITSDDLPNPPKGMKRVKIITEPTPRTKPDLDIDIEL